MPDIAAGFIGLEDVFKNRVTQVGVDVIRDAIDQSTQAYSIAFDQIMSNLVVDVDPNKVQERYKLPASGTMQPLDEWGRPKPVKGEQWFEQAYPLHMAGHAWAANWVSLAKMTVQEANDNVMAALRADADWNIRHILAVLFHNASWTFPAMENTPELTIYPLAAGEAGVKYMTRAGSLETATHYAAQLAAIDADNNPYKALYKALRRYVYNNGAVVAYINNDERAATEALPGFVAVGDPDVQEGANSDTLVGRIDGHMGDEVVGKVNNVWIIEWERVPSGYILGHVHGTKVVGRRQQPESDLQGLISREITDGNLTNYEFYRHAGYAPRNRVGAYVVQIGAASYTPPAGYTVLPLAI